MLSGEARKQTRWNRNRIPQAKGLHGPRKRKGKEPMRHLTPALSPVEAERERKAEKLL
jgi:hypothetical protein